jgi:hypothetical protein
LLLWNLVVPAIILLPVTLSGAAAAHRALVITLFVVFFGTYGTCIPLIRDGASGWAEKVLLTGTGPRRWIAERLIAAATLDVAQLLPVMVLLLWLTHVEPREATLTLMATALALVFANMLGTLVAALVRSMAEAALGCAVLALFALHLGGAFRRPTPGTWTELAAHVSPLRPLHETWLLALSSGDAPAPRLHDFGRPALMVALGLAAVLLLGGILGRRIAAIGRG